MLSNSEHIGLTEAELNYRLGMANLDGAMCLCREMIIGHYKSTFDHATVILSLFHHSIELFLKYALLTKGVNPPKDHYIRGLFREYEQTYPDLGFSLRLPFITEFLGFTAEEVMRNIAEEGHDKNRNDKMVRYHTDHSGNRWDMIQAFEPNMFLAQAEEISNELIRIRGKIEKDSDRLSSR